MLQAPQVIFFDAVGTLFGVRGSVGQIYSQLAQQNGVAVDPVQLDRAFIQSFRTAPRAAFPGVPAVKLANYEVAWWQAIAKASFQQVGVLEQFSDFPGFFRQLFDYFATAAPWFVYADVPATLSHCQAAGIQLGIISNFDSRLYRVLEILDLAKFFSSVTISTAVGAAKPALEIFQTALRQHHCPAERAWHVGDSYVEDYQGATTAGLRSIWVSSETGITNQPTVPPPDTVSQLAALLSLLPTNAS